MSPRCMILLTVTTVASLLLIPTSCMWEEVIQLCQGWQADIPRGCDIFPPLEEGPVNREAERGVPLSLTASPPPPHPNWSSCALRTMTWSCGISPPWLDITKEVLCQLGQSLPLDFEVSNCNAAVSIACFLPGFHDSRCPLFLCYTKREGLREHSLLREQTQQGRDLTESYHATDTCCLIACAFRIMMLLWDWYVAHQREYCLPLVVGCPAACGS